MKIEDLIPILEAATVPEKIPDMEAYMKNKFSFLGVQKPILKKIEREFFKPFIKNPIDWAFVEECWQQPYREFQYIAMDYLDKKKKELRPEDFPKLKHSRASMIISRRCAPSASVSPAQTMARSLPSPAPSTRATLA